MEINGNALKHIEIVEIEKWKLLEIIRNNHFKKYLACWLNKWRYIESPIKGDDLINQGWEVGPDLGIEIKRQRMKLIDEQNTI